MGKAQQVKSFFYVPGRDKDARGLVSNYEILIGQSLDAMQVVASGEFSNIRNNPVMQSVYFTPVDARFVTLRATRMVVPGEKLGFDKIAVR